MDKAMLEALARAMELEVDGRKFYLEAAGNSKNEFGKKMFDYLADQELQHQRRIKEIYERLQKGQPWPSLATALPTGGHEAVFGAAAKGQVSGADDDKKAVQVALGLEDKSYDYYNDLSRKAADLGVKRFFAALCYEERGHYLMLLDSLDYLSDPAGWYSRHEHQLLDG
jgi:rubrerythrin